MGVTSGDAAAPGRVQGGRVMALRDCPHEGQSVGVLWGCWCAESLPPLFLSRSGKCENCYTKTYVAPPGTEDGDLYTGKEPFKPVPLDLRTR